MRHLRRLVAHLRRTWRQELSRHHTTLNDRSASRASSLLYSLQRCLLIVQRQRLAVLGRPPARPSAHSLSSSGPGGCAPGGPLRRGPAPGGAPGGASPGGAPIARCTRRARASSKNVMHPGDSCARCAFKHCRASRLTRPGHSVFMSGAQAMRIGGPCLAHRGTAVPGPGGAADSAPGPEGASEGGGGTAELWRRGTGRRRLILGAGDWRERG